MRTLLPVGRRTRWKIFLKGSLHTHLPGVYTVGIEFKTVDKLYDLIYGHAVAEDTGYQFRIIPVLRIELIRKALYSGLESAFVDELEVITLHAFIIDSLYDLAFVDRFGTEYAILVIGKACEYLIRTPVDKSDKSDPLLLVVLEPYHISLQFHRPLKHQRMTYGIRWRFEALLLGLYGILFLLLVL